MNQRHFQALAAGVFILLLACSCNGLKYSLPKIPVGQIATPEKQWDQAFSRNSGWTGGDVASSFVIPGKRVLWVFGDSFIGEIADNRRLNATMVNNSIAIHPDDPANPGKAPEPREIRFYWGENDSSGKPTAWIRPASGSAKTWYWPTGGGAVLSQADGDLRLALFLIELTKKPGEDSVWGFQCIRSSLAMVDNVEERAELWQKRVIDLPPPADWGVAVLSEPSSDYVFIYGAESDPQNHRELKLARARTQSFEDFAQWEFFAGEGKWEKTFSHASAIVKDIASELTVEKVPDQTGAVHLVMIYSEPFLGSRILVRNSSHPQGPWSDPKPIFQVPEVKRSKTLFAYAAKGHFGISDPGTLLVSYIVNSQDFNELINHASLYHPKFISVPLRQIVIH